MDVIKVAWPAARSPTVGAGKEKSSKTLLVNKATSKPQLLLRKKVGLIKNNPNLNLVVQLYDRNELTTVTVSSIAHTHEAAFAVMTRDAIISQYS